jgi:putative transposase
MSPTSFRVLWPDVGPEGTMKTWLVGSGIPRRTLCASCAARTSWPPRAKPARRSPPYGGMDADAAKELKELREQNARLKRLLAEAELEKDALREVAKGKF